MACPHADTPVTQLQQDVAEDAVLCLVNEQRTANGVPALTMHPALRTAAREHAKEAVRLKWWAGGGNKVHTNPETQSTPRTRIRDAGYCPPDPQTTNENCYHGWFAGGVEFQKNITPRAAVTWWMGSDGHRRTLLDPAYRETGVGVVLGTAEPQPQADGGGVFVQTFGGCP
ncbi:MAG TPA: CAP domain-containing protein [Thermomonospora sp.]|nr:CAP domain-containing protein [Thermomonospora sp.]